MFYDVNNERKMGKNINSRPVSENVLVLRYPRFHNARHGLQDDTSVSEMQRQ